MIAVISAEQARMADFEDVRRGAGLALADAARCWLGTPYQHAQRVKGVAVDCVGLVLCAAEEAGLFRWEEWDGPRQYSPWVNSGQLQAQIGRLLCPLPDDAELWTGDVLLFQIGGAAQHVGIYRAPKHSQGGRARLIHACMSVGRVVEHDYERFWKARTVARHRWRIPWLDDLEVAHWAETGGTDG